MKKIIIFSVFVFFGLSIISCSKSDDFDISFSEDDLFCWEYADFKSEGSPSLWMIYYYQNNEIKTSNTNNFETKEIIPISSLSLQIKLSQNTPVECCVANKLPFKYSDYGKFELTPDKSKVYNGLYEYNNTQSSSGRFLIALNSQNKTATIYFFKTKNVLKKVYETTFADNGDPILVIKGMNMGHGPEIWRISNNMIALDYNQTGVYSFSVEDESGNVFGFANSLFVVDDKR